MTTTHFGDLAQHMMLSRQTNNVKTNLNRLALELATGTTSDVSKAVRGDFTLLSDVERQLTVLKSYEAANAKASLITETAQYSLEMIQSITEDLSNSILGLSSGSLDAPLDNVIYQSQEAFEAIVGFLNTRVAGSSVFAGADTGSGALASASDMMAELSAAVAGAATPADVAAIVDDWFMSPGGGFETNGYSGSANDMADFQLSETEKASFGTRADDMVLRQIMRDVAIAALADDPGLGFDSDQKAELVQLGGESLFVNQQDLTSLRAEVGFVEQRIEDIGTRNAARTTSLSITLNDLISVDPVDIAGELTQAETQLEMIYAVTARLSSLSLMNYMR